MEKFDYYNDYNNTQGYYYRFLERNPEFAIEEFEEFVIINNKGDRFNGQLNEIAKHEVLRLAYEFIEQRWRFPDFYSQDAPIMK